ncbi:hypothetical protein Tco_1381383 [Tanacetum coccineum]
MKNILTAKEKEEMRRPTVENFQRLLDSLMNYNKVHATIPFYPKKRRNIRPKAVFIPEASPKDVYDYYIHGLVDTVYINGETLKELQEFPPKVQSIIKGYKEIFARGRELFLKMLSSYLIFDKEQKILVPQLGERIDEVQLKSQTAKLNVVNRMKNIPTTKVKEEMRRPTVEKFQRLLDSLINYNEVHKTMLFDPKKRRNIGPKAVFFPEASPKDVYDYYVHGLVYINGETFKKLQEFPLKVQSMIKGYIEISARE